FQGPDMRGSDITLRPVSPRTANGRSYQPEGFEVALTLVTLAVTAVACVLLAVESMGILRKMADRNDVPGALGQILFMLIVVLLIDDPALPANAHDQRALRRIESLPVRLQALFAEVATRFGRECAAYECRHTRGAIDFPVEAQRISHLYENAAQWLEEQASNLVGDEPGDELLRGKVFLSLAGKQRARARDVASRARAGALEELH